MPEKMVEMVKFRIALYKRLKKNEEMYQYYFKREQNGEEEDNRVSERYINYFVEDKDILEMVDDILVRMNAEWGADNDF